MLTPADFAQRLKKGTLIPSTVLIGLVKDVDGGDAYIHFSPDGCASWIRIPTSLVDGVRLIRHVRCGDHSHPLVELHLINESPNPESQALLQVLSSVMSEAESGLGDGDDELDEGMLSVDQDLDANLATPASATIRSCIGRRCRARNGRIYPCRMIRGGRVYCHPNCCIG